MSGIGQYLLDNPEEPKEEPKVQKRSIGTSLLADPGRLGSSEQIRKNAHLTQTSTPDQVADDHKLSLESNLSTDLISRNRDTVKGEVEADTIEKTTRDSRGVANYLFDYNNMAVSRDDVDNLVETEGLFKQYVVDPAKAVAKLAPRALYTIEGGVADILAMFPGAVDSAYDYFESLTGLKAGPDYGVLRDLLHEHSRGTREILEDNLLIGTSEDLKGKRLWDNPELLLDPEWVIQNLGDAAASMAPTIAAAVLSGGSTLLGALVGGMMEGGALYNQMMEEEKVDQGTALSASMAFSGVSLYLNKICLDAILDKTVVKSLKARIFKSFVKGGVEATTEWAEEPAEALIKSLAEGDAAEDIINKIKDAATNVDVIPGAFLMGGGVAYVSQYRNEYKKSMQAEQDVQFFEALDTAAENSKTRERMPEAYERAVEKILQENEGAVESVYVDAELFQAAFVENIQGLNEILDKTGIREQYEDTLLTGGEVAIPIAKYAAYVAGTDASLALRSDVKFRKNSMSVNEAKEFNQTLTEDLQKEMEAFSIEREAETLFEGEQQQIYEDVLAKRQAVGRVGESARSDAVYWAAHSTVFAKRYNLTPMDVYRQIVPEVVAEQFADREGREALEQKGRTVESIEAQWKEEDVNLSLHEKDDQITLDNIIIPKEKRKEGLGSRVIEDLVSYADATNKRIVLTPAVKDDYQGTTSRSRLVKFYKRFGFVESKGRNIDYSIGAGKMYREPVGVDLKQIEKLDAELQGGLEQNPETGDIEFHPVKAALSATQLYQGIERKGVEGKYLRGGRVKKVSDNVKTLTDNLDPGIINQFDQVKDFKEAIEFAKNIKPLAPTVITKPSEIEKTPGFDKKTGKKKLRWGKSGSKGYEELGKAFYGNDKMKFPNDVYPHGRNTWDIPGCAREAWAVNNGVDVTQACYGGACYAESLIKVSQGTIAGVSTGIKVSPLRGVKKEDVKLRKDMNAYFKKKGIKATQEKWPEYQVKVNTLKGSKNYGKLSISTVSDALPAAVVSTQLQDAKGADIRLGVDTDGAAWLSDKSVMDAIMKADPRTLTVYSSAYHKPPEAHLLAGRTIINVTVSGWHPIPETLARIKWAEQARNNGWNVILREVVANPEQFDLGTAKQYNRLHDALLKTDFFIMQQPLHIGRAHGEPMWKLPSCCVGSEKNFHTCDQCEVAEGLGKKFQEYWKIHEEEDKAGEIVMPDSTYEGRQLYQGLDDQDVSLAEEAKTYEDADDFIEKVYKRQVRKRTRIGGAVAKRLGGKYQRKAEVPESIAPSIGDYGGKISVDGQDIYFGASSENGVIYLSNIATEAKGFGLGTKFMNALKEFADETSQGIQVYKVTNPKFFEKFDWLEKKDGDFKYTPETDTFTGVSDLRDIWKKSQEKPKGFDKWSKGHETISGPEIVDAEPDKGYVFRVYHGTTHEFDVFDPTVKGTKEGQFGAVNYFTSDEGDASMNYAGEGPDLTSRIEQRKDQLAQELPDMDLDEIQDAFDLEEEVTEDTDFEDLAKEIATKELSGGEPRTLDAFVRLDNPAYIGGDTETWIENIDTEQYREDATEEILDENDADKSQIEEFEDEINERIYEMGQDDESEIAVAIRDAIQQFETDVNVDDVLSNMEIYESEISATDLEKQLRANEALFYGVDYDSETGDLIGSHIIGQVFKNLGYDGIVLQDAAKRFENMGLGADTSHIHIFEETPSQIKSALENVGEFDPDNPNIYFQEPKDIPGGPPKGAVTKFELGKTKPIIKLFETANPSTFLHESMHVFTMFMGQSAQQPNAPQALKDDWNTLTELVGNDGVSPLTDAQFEKLARAGEAYFMEGKAPSLKLRGVFQQFMDWLKAIYKQAVKLDAPINDGVRQVFARMFATDQDIEEAQQFYDSQKPFFEEAEIVDQEEKDKYNKLRTTADDDAKIKRFQKYVKAHLDAIGGKKAIESQVELELNAMPVYVAIDTAMEAGGFSISMANMMIGEVARKKAAQKRKGLFTREGEVNPDEVAAQNGFDSVEAMYDAMIIAESKGELKKTMVDNRLKQMEQQIRDGLIEGEELKADPEYHSDAKLALLIAEVEMLKKQQPKKKAKATQATAGAIREVARQVLLTKPVSEAAGYYRYSQAEAKAARQARKAKDKGDVEGAERFKRRELLNHALTLESIAVKDEVRKGVQYTRKSVKSKALSQEAFEQIRDLAARFGLLSRRPKETLEKRLLAIRKGSDQTLKEWAEAMEETGYPVTFEDFLLKHNYIEDYKQITFAQFRSVIEGVKVVRTIDRQERMYLSGEEAKTLEQVKGEMLDQLLLTHKGKDKAPGLHRKKVREFFAGVHASHTKMEFLFKKLDNDSLGPWWTYLFKPIADAENNRADRVKAASEYIQSKALFGTYSLAERTKMFNKRILIEEISESLTKSQILSVALNVGNEDNKSKLLDGYGWNDQQLDAILDKLDKRDWTFVQSVWDYLETFRPEAFQLQKDITGRSPKKVEANEVITEHGRYKGGYYPISFDTRLSYRAFQREQKEMDKFMFGGRNYGSAMTKQGHLQERKAGAGGQQISLDLAVFTDHVFNVVHDITHRRAVLDVAKLIRDKEIRAALDSAVGIEMSRELQPWLQDIAREYQEPTHMVHRLARWARGGATIMNMGFKFTTMFTQLVGYTQTVDQMGVKNAAKGLDMFYGTGSEHTELGDRIDFVLEKSGFMRGRLKSFDRDIKDATKGLTPTKEMSAAVQRFAFMGIGLMQMGVDMPTWYGAYDQGLKEFNDDKKAVAHADSMVRITQGAGGTKDLSRIQRGGDLPRMFTMFYSYFNTLYNLSAKRYSEVNSYKDVGALAASALWLWFLPALLSELIAGRGPDDDEDWAEWAVPLLVMYPFQTVVGVRDLANAVFGDFGYQLTPAQAAPKEISQWFNHIQKAIEEEDPRRAVEQTAEAVGYIAKLPMKQVLITTGNIWDYITGEDPEFEIRDLFFRKRKK